MSLSYKLERISSQSLCKMDFSRYYFDKDFSGSFSGVNTFYNALKKIDSTVKRSDVLEYLKSNKVYSLHKPIKKPKQYRRVYTKGIKYLFQMDLIEVGKMANENDNHKFLVTIIDCFSKYAWVFPTKNKSGKEVYNKIKALLLVERPLKLQTDRGFEFYNKTFKAMTTALNINHYSTGSHLKASIVERFNRTLKTRLERVFTFQGNQRYIDILPKVVEAYNNSVHRSIGMAPVEVTAANSKQVLLKLYPKHDKKDGKLYSKNLDKQYKPRYKVGDAVRITKEKGTFEKGFTQNWSKEIFRINRVLATDPITYKITDYISDILEGNFYEAELQAVKSQTPAVERVIQSRKRGGITQYLVKYQNYPEEANNWLTREQIIENAN